MMTVLLGRVTKALEAPPVVGHYRQALCR